MSTPDQRAERETLIALATAMGRTLDQMGQAIGEEVRAGLWSVWLGLETLAVRQFCDWTGAPSGREDIILSGSYQLVVRLPRAPSKTISPRQDRLPVLLRQSNIDYLRLCLVHGLDPATLIMPLADFIARDLAEADAAVRDPYLELLLEELAAAAPARDANGRCAWGTITAFDRDPALKVRLLRRQIAAHPDHFEAATSHLSRNSRRCAPLLILALCGARIGALDPDDADDVSARRMQLLCSKLSSHHGLMELHAQFGAPETLLPQIQSRLDAYLAEHGAPSI